MLQGKTAIVTGSTSGIGLGIARELAKAGANIVLNGLGDPADNAKTASQIAGSFGVKVEFSPADISKPEGAAELVKLAQKLGGPDILVNNAGIQHVAPVEEFPLETWEAIIALNLSAAFYATRLCIPHMKMKKWGRVISTASAHSLVASPFKSAYVAAKHGIAGFTKSVALEVASFGITVNAISPGYVWTPLVEKQIPDTMAARKLTREEVINDVLLKAQPTKQFVAVEEVAALALYLCSDMAKNITGANLSMDGGWTAQ